MDREPTGRRYESGGRGEKARRWTIQKKFWVLFCGALICWGAIVALILLI